MGGHCCCSSRVPRDLPKLLLLKMVMNVRVLHNLGNFLTGWGRISFLRRSLLHWVVDQCVACLRRRGGPVPGVGPFAGRWPAIPRATGSGFQWGLRHALHLWTGPRSGLSAEQTYCSQVSRNAFCFLSPHQACSLLGHTALLSGIFLQVFQVKL